MLTWEKKAQGEAENNKKKELGEAENNMDKNTSHADDILLTPVA
jgi:hypothetical protein